MWMWGMQMPSGRTDRARGGAGGDGWGGWKDAGGGRITRMGLAGGGGGGGGEERRLRLGFCFTARASEPASERVRACVCVCVRASGAVRCGRLACAAGGGGDPISGGGGGGVSPTRAGLLPAAWRQARPGPVAPHPLHPRAGWHFSPCHVSPWPHRHPSTLGAELCMHETTLHQHAQRLIPASKIKNTCTASGYGLMRGGKVPDPHTACFGFPTTVRTLRVAPTDTRHRACRHAHGLPFARQAPSFHVSVKRGRGQARMHYFDAPPRMLAQCWPAPSTTAPKTSSGTRPLLPGPARHADSEPLPHIVSAPPCPRFWAGVRVQCPLRRA